MFVSSLPQASVNRQLRASEPPGLSLLAVPTLLISCSRSQPEQGPDIIWPT